MDLSKVKKIVETNSLTDANRLIAAGWFLITTSSMTTDSREYSGPVVKYSLGWAKDSDPVEPSSF